MVFAKSAETIGQHVDKGQPVLVHGRLPFGSWDDKQTGQRRSTHEVVADRRWPLSGGGKSSRKPGSDDESFDSDVPF